MKKHNISENPDFYRLVIFDWVVIILIVFFSVASLTGIAQSSMHLTTNSATALIYVQGKMFREVNLSQNGVFDLPTFKSNSGMTIEVKNGSIKVVRSDCPKHICSHFGAIHYPAQTIVCVPNKILIEIKSDSKFLDVVAY